MVFMVPFKCKIILKHMDLFVYRFVSFTVEIKDSHQLL